MSHHGRIFFFNIRELLWENLLTNGTFINLLNIDEKCHVKCEITYKIVPSLIRQTTHAINTDIFVFFKVIAMPIYLLFSMASQDYQFLL